MKKLILSSLTIFFILTVNMSPAYSYKNEENDNTAKIDCSPFNKEAFFGPSDIFGKTFLSIFNKLKNTETGSANTEEENKTTSTASDITAVFARPDSSDKEIEDGSL